MGCAVDNLNMAETLDVVEGFIRSGKPHQHVVVNVDKIVKANRDPALRQIINDCDLINADGMPVVWASVFLLGAREEVVSGVARRYPARYPGLTLAGYRNGYWTPEEEEKVVADIAATRPDILFVAISSPKKEAFLARYQAAMKVPFAMGVGGTFDVAVGLVKRAPVWMQNAGLEWFYRFLQEPRRMFRRYFIDDMAFVALFAREWVKR